MIELLSNKFGLIFLLLIVLFLWLAYLTFLVQNYIKGRKRILEEGGEKGVDCILEDLSKQIKKQDLDIKELYHISDQLSELAAKSIIHVGIVRYNAFLNITSDLSFSIALLNSKKDGLILSGLHSREGTNIFSKPIKAGQPTSYQLSKEEQEAIKKALNN